MQKPTSDITVIGSGISASFSIINFLDLIEKQGTIDKAISINIIEKYSEFNSGVPYGSRSGFSTLLITSLEDFLPEPELSLFIKWLNKNKSWLIEELEKEGGVLSKKWLNNHEDNISHNNWKELFIPRRFIGCYINLRVNTKIEELTKKGFIEVNFINGNVIDIDKNENSYNISLEDSLEISSKKIVLAVGSLPKNYLWKNKDVIQEKNFLFINNPYKPEIALVLNKITNFITNRYNKATNILIVGANASALEILYKVNDIETDKHPKTNFTFLSTLGRIPDAVVDKEKQRVFVPRNLNELKKEKTLTAKIIAEATFKDLDDADDVNLGAASSVEVISEYFGVLLNKLDSKELEIFACHYGNEIGKRQRCAGLHYLNVISDLEKQNRFEHIIGRFNNLECDIDGNYSLKYLDTATKKDKIHNQPFHIIINCTGGKNLTQDDIPILHKNLIKKNYCTPNESKIGFRVNESLEASENLHIMGPLLGGNVIENKAVWHVEHCGRIIWLSKVLSKIIFNDLFQNETSIIKNHKSETSNMPLFTGTKE